MLCCAKSGTMNRNGRSLNSCLEVQDVRCYTCWYGGMGRDRCSKMVRGRRGLLTSIRSKRDILCQHAQRRAHVCGRCPAALINCQADQPGYVQCIKAKDHAQQCGTTGRAEMQATQLMRHAHMAPTSSGLVFKLTCNAELWHTNNTSPQCC